MLDKRKLAQVLAEKAKTGQIKPEAPQQIQPSQSNFKPITQNMMPNPPTAGIVASNKPKFYKFPNIQKLFKPKF